MSMTSRCVYGFGFHCDCNEDVLIEFIKAHKDAFCWDDEDKKLYEEFLDYTSSNYDLEDFFEDYACDTTGEEGLGAVISNIISRETGIGFCYHRPVDECDIVASIMFEPCFPWDLNKKERNLTYEELESIFIRYMCQLGIKGEVQYLALEYFS